MNRLKAWFKTFVSDGLWTSGPQIAMPKGVQAMMFARCIQCHAIFPHWLASMTAAEVKARGKIGCSCGGLRIQPCIIPSWQAFYWFAIRGWLIRKVILRARSWDPRMVVMESDKGLDSVRGGSAA